MLISHGSSSVRREPNLGYELFIQDWNSLGRKIEQQQNQLAQNIFIELDSFIRDTHKHWLFMEWEESRTRGSKYQYRQIPTAIVLSGVNTPDHRVMYDQLRSSVLHSHGRVAVIHSGSVISSARSLVSAVISQLVSTDCEIDSFMTDRGNSNRLDIQKILAPSVASTYLGLYHWYYSRLNSECISFSDEEGNMEIGVRRSLSQPTSFQNKSVRCNSATRTDTPRRFSPRRLGVHPDSREQRTPSASRLHGKHGHGAGRPSTRCKEVLPPEKLGPLVIILPQVESIPATILQEFIELTSIYVSEENNQRPHTLPVILVFGLCASPEVSFESRLSASTLARLQIKQFTVPPPTSFLEAVLTELISFPKFRLTYMVLTFLIDSVFLCLDFSVQNFVRRFKFCMLDYYLRCPHPQLMLAPDQARQYLQSLSASEIAHCVSVHYPSMSSSVIDSPHGRHASVTAPSDNMTRSPGKHVVMLDHLTHRLEAHWKLAYMAPRLLRWIFTLIQSIPTSPLGRSIIDLYRQWLKDGLVNTQAFSTTMNLFHGLSKTEFINAVEEALRVLHNCTIPRDSGSPSLWPDSIVRDANTSLTEFSNEVSQWCEELRAAGEEPSTKVTASANQSVTPSPLATSSQSVFGGQRKMSLRGLKQHLQEIAHSPSSAANLPRAASQTKWDQKRHEFLVWTRSEFTRLLPVPTSLPLHEVFYSPVAVGRTRSQGIAALRRRLNPTVPRVLHQTLVNPGEILQIPEFKLDSPESLSPRLPDLCILYKLHLESLKMINMYDWLMAFATVLGETVDSTKSPSESIQSRFFYGVAQLHHLGYVKSTRRKADHVQRLTWGLTV